MNVEDARKIERVTIEVGRQYPFFAEMQQEYEPQHLRMRNHTGTLVTVVDRHEPEDAETSVTYTVCAKDGFMFVAQEEELNDWDRDLGQYFWPDATHGPERSTRFLVNEGRR